MALYAINQEIAILLNFGQLTNTTSTRRSGGILSLRVRTVLVNLLTYHEVNFIVTRSFARGSILRFLSLTRINVKLLYDRTTNDKIKIIFIFTCEN